MNKTLPEKSSERIQRAALTSGYADYNKKLNLYALSRTSNSEMSADLVQETFLKTWKFLVRGGSILKMEAFLYHVLKDLIIDEYRKKKAVSLDALLEKGFETGLDTREQLIDMLDGKEALLLIQYLPLPYRQVIRMRFIQELSLTEISLITGKTKNATAVHIHRGLEKLRILLNQNTV
jgi:RNA polymerase sigma-70 factor (ECF subfamily)